MARTLAQSILVPVDFSEVTDRVLEAGVELAKALQAKLWLLHVTMPEPDFVGYEVGPIYVRDSVAEQFRHEHRMLQEMEKKLEAQGLDVTAMLVQGPTVRKIIDEAKELEAGLIILGSHGHGALFDLLVGSVAKGVLKKTPVPVLVVPTVEGEPEGQQEEADETPAGD
jgi:nucleotide-binding universal stress UspA family protein